MPLNDAHLEGLFTNNSTRVASAHGSFFYALKKSWFFSKIFGGLLNCCIFVHQNTKVPPRSSAGQTLNKTTQCTGKN
jgi:hypothetical protein